MEARADLQAEAAEAMEMEMAVVAVGAKEVAGTCTGKASWHSIHTFPTTSLNGIRAQPLAPGPKSSHGA